MMEEARTSETSVDNHFTRQYNPEDSSEHHIKCSFSLINSAIDFLFTSVFGDFTSQVCKFLYFFDDLVVYLHLCASVLISAAD
jgi:hypothetical protein